MAPWNVPTLLACLARLDWLYVAVPVALALGIVLGLVARPAWEWAMWRWETRRKG